MTSSTDGTSTDTTITYLSTLAQQLQKVHHQHISPLNSGERPIIQEILRRITHRSYLS